MLDLITQVRNLVLEAEQKGQKLLAAKLRTVADEIEALVSAEKPTSGPASESGPGEAYACGG